MKVRIVYWNEYIPDCPADLEVSDPTVLGVFTESVYADEDTADAIRRYKDDRIREDYDGLMRGHWDSESQSVVPYIEGSEAHQNALYTAQEERREAEANFEEHYGGFFSHEIYELDVPQRIYIHDDQEVAQ